MKHGAQGRGRTGSRGVARSAAKEERRDAELLITKDVTCERIQCRPIRSKVRSFKASSKQASIKHRLAMAEDHLTAFAWQRITRVHGRGSPHCLLCPGHPWLFVTARKAALALPFRPQLSLPFVRNQLDRRNQRPAASASHTHAPLHYPLRARLRGMK